MVLFGGPVSNRQATAALIGAVPAGTAALCTGDTVAYCADPAATVAALRATGWPVIADNVERQLAEGALDCGCGFGDGTACDRFSGAWYAHANAEIDADDRAWMAELPDFAVFRHDGRRYGVLHGGATAINRFLFETSSEEAFVDEIQTFTDWTGPLDGIVAGHSGLPFVRSIGGLLWINAGAIGMPPNDGRSETAFVVLDGGAPRIARLAYDWRSARDAMRAAGLTQGYDSCLETGFWPSEDVLPPDLRRT